MFYNRHLPHDLPEGAILHVTWRLSNSLPAPQPEILLKDYKPPRPLGPTWLKDERIAQMLVDALNYGAAERRDYNLFAYVVMPNHVHILIEPLEELSTIMCWLKGRTARLANRILERKNQPFWQDESYDHWIRTAKEFNETIHYIENNPVRAKLVELPEDWRWSSACHYQEDREAATGLERPPTIHGSSCDLYV